MPTISVIIPTLNEAGGIASTIASLREAGLDDILVVDGGSEDDTVGIAGNLGCTVIGNVTGGRAGQMNRGAENCDGDVLFFLHGDTTLPVRAAERLRKIAEPSCHIVGGGFVRYFESPSLFLKLTCWLAGIRSRWFGVFLGDQGIFVRREIFETLEGFDETLPYGEDLDFSMRMRTLGKTATITPAVLSSARRFDQKGPLGQTLSDFTVAREIIRESRERIAAS
ncbi:MAG: TIGR04283 family arsenosugar biosynthesis glycosyltransferase [Verrucomicrobiales bacterium]|nr:TIGR04283 family arsenosugar biosynthesis glycosyltransferase [Verrucomicrobiales bacterium]